LFINLLDTKKKVILFTIQQLLEYLHLG